MLKPVEIYAIKCADGSEKPLALRYEEKNYRIASSRILNLYRLEGIRGTVYLIRIGHHLYKLIKPSEGPYMIQSEDILE